MEALHAGKATRLRSEGAYEGHELVSGVVDGRRTLVGVEHPKGERSCRIAQLLRMFETWQDEPAGSLERVEVAGPPRALFRLGVLEAVIYRSDKWRKTRTYLHDFSRPRPTLAGDEHGQLHVVGGSYELTPDGIEG